MIQKSSLVKIGKENGLPPETPLFDILNALLGKVRLTIGKVSMLVITGLLFHSSKALLINRIAVVKLPATIHIHSIFSKKLFPVEM